METVEEDTEEEEGDEEQELVAVKVENLKINRKEKRNQ